MKTIFKLLSYLPLLVLHTLGAFMGALVWLFSSNYRRSMRNNIVQAGFGWRIVLGSILHTGQMVAELPRLWLGRPVRVRWSDRPALDRLFAQSQTEHRGIVILAPHMGCWEVVGQSIADAGFERGLQMTVMYRPARQAWLDSIIRASRERPSMKTVPADLSGVRQLLRVLKAKQIIGLLPDQVPADGMGVWSDVFGKPAYTMTMAAKMIQTTNAIPVLCWCERLTWGRGYRMFTQVLDLNLAEDLNGVVQQINHGVELAIRALPEQYLWSYARYKAPRAA